MVARFVSQDHVVLGQRRRQRLEAMVRRGTAQAREVTRARIVLAAADRCSNAQIAAWVGVHVDTVRRVRRRFVVEGMSSLSDRPRPGRPLLYGPDARLLVVATATSVPRDRRRYGRTPLSPSTCCKNTGSRSRPVRSDGSWASWTSNRTWSAAG